MTIDDLRKDETVYRYLEPMPKMVIDEINSEIFNHSQRYVAYLEKFGKEVIYRVWAYRRTKTYGLQHREVMRAILGEEGLLYRDMYLNYCGGYKVVYKSSRGSSSNWYGYTYYAYDENDFGKWIWTDKVGVAIKVLNEELLQETNFKYSGYNGNGNFLEWMRVYKEYPQVEFLGKLGYEPSKKLLKKAAKDKAFCKYLAKTDPHNNINAIIYSYNHHISVSEASKLLTEKNEIGRMFKGYPEIKRADLDLQKVYGYIITQKNGTIANYCDYIKACIGLKLDLKDTKNAFPKDFQRMHDTRVAQWKVKKNKKKNKDFKLAAQKYKQFEIQGDKYSIVIPKSFKDLANEGTKLHHCVADMGYDGKMIEGKSFIAFVRKNDALKDPFVTVEYGIERKEVLQIHGINNSSPASDVKDFVKAWSKKVKKAI